MRGSVRCVASGDREPAATTRSSWRSALSGACEAVGLRMLTLELFQAGMSPIAPGIAGNGRLGGLVSGIDLNGIQVRPRPLLMQLVQGNDPLHRFFEARHVVQAVLARRRFAGWTLGRPMLEKSKIRGRVSPG